jgi:ribosomal protein S18 acetylase RimI-like enzyme
MQMCNFDKFVGKNYEYLPLEWDTNYFDIPSARVNLNGIIDLESQDNIINFCKKYTFITISNINNIKENNHWIGSRTNAFLTDINIQYIKELINIPINPNDNTKVFDNYKKNENIMNIAKDSFKYSRFFNDPNLPKKQAENIYSYWTQCAFKKENKYFVISKIHDLIAGYILFSIANESKTGVIELIAVDEKFRGQRVGKSLLQTMESNVSGKGINKIKVGTQVDNISATQFYNSVGFKYTGCRTIYHLWNV